MKRFYGILTIALLVLILNASESFSQSFGFGVRGGQNFESKDQFVGGQVEVGFSKFTFSPNVEYYLGLPSLVKTHYDINLDGQYELFSLVVAKIFVGGGYVISKTKADIPGAKSVSSNGFNIQGGAKMNLLFLHPFGLVKWAKIKEAKSLSLVIGANIGF